MNTGQRAIASLLAVVAVASWLPGAATADIINVPGDYPTIQAAIDAAQDGDEIVVAPGSYVENIDLAGKAITLRSQSGASATTIDGGDIRATIRCESGENPQTIIDGFTVTNGRGELATEPLYQDPTLRLRGGGIYVHVSSPTIRNCTIAGNHTLIPGEGTSGVGGGFYSFGGLPLVANCVVTGNTVGCTSQNHGGGVYGTATFLDCVISSNQTCGSGASGAGGYAIGGSFTRCIFRFNEGAGGGNCQGVGLQCVFLNPPTLTDCTVCGNTGGGCANDTELAGIFIDGGGNVIQQQCPAGCTGDVDGDNEIGIVDFLALLTNWGPCQ